MRREILFGPFRLDVQNKRLCRADEEVALAPKAIDLLIHLAERSGNLLTREELFEALWPGTFVDDHALSVQIREIRKALGDDVKKPAYIETRPRRGYCFIAEVRAVQPVEETAAAGAGSATVSVSRLRIPETHYANSHGVNLAYQVLGEGPLDLVFVMGWISHLEYFWTEPYFARFLRRIASFSRLVLFDKRGTGLSDRIPLAQLPTLEQRMDDVRAVMDAAAASRAVLCGVSEGGPMSALFAATYPERTLGLVMIGSYARRIRDADYPWGPTLEERERFLQQIRERWGGPVGLEERAPSLISDPRFCEWWATYLRMGASPGAAVALTQMNSEVDVRSVLPLVRVPTLVIHRAGDRCLKVEEGRFLASHIPGAEYVELPGEDHLPFVGDQDGILAPVERFVARLELSLRADRVLATVLASELCAASDAPGLLNAHVREELRRFRGIETHSEPGKLVATFDGPARAIRCACAIVDGCVRAGSKARAGLHTGECERPEGPDASGPAVQIAKAIQFHAGPGEVVCSRTLRDLVAGSGIEFEHAGEIPVTALGHVPVLRVRRQADQPPIVAPIRS